MSVVIVNKRIDGLRVTVYDVLHDLEAGRTGRRDRRHPAAAGRLYLP
jgi:hypothetical protein